MMSRIWIFALLSGWLQLACAGDTFSLQAEYADAKLQAIHFEYRSPLPPTGVKINGKMLADSGCFARIPGSDNLTPFLAGIRSQSGYAAIADTRQRIRQAMAKTGLEIWQEVLCVAANTFPETVKGNPGKWGPASIYLDGQRQGVWNDVYTVVRPNHLYSITVHPRNHAN